jgi:hypothetical protein
MSTKVTTPTMQKDRSELLLVALLTIVAMSTRILFNKLHFFNFNAVMASAFFAGAYLSKRKLALIIPIAALFLTDLALGLYDWRLMGFVYGSFALVLFFGQYYREHSTLLSWVMSLLGGSISFFLITNFASWLFAEGMTAYAHNFAGLMQAYTMGLPFYRNTLLGDIGFSAALFGAYELFKLRTSARQTVAA